MAYMMKQHVFRTVQAMVVLAGVGGAGSIALAQNTKTAPTSTPAKPAPVSADPASTSATYGDWVLRCQRVGDGDKSQRLCEVAQTLQVQGQQQPIAQVAFGHVNPSEPMRFTVALPNNISLPGSVVLNLGEKEPAPMAMAWRRCVPGACIADATPNAEEMKTIRAAAEPGRLVFKDAAGRDVALPLSFRGFAQAMDALAKA